MEKLGLSQWQVADRTKYILQNNKAEIAESGSEKWNILPPEGRAACWGNVRRMFCDGGVWVGGLRRKLDKMDGRRNVSREENSKITSF